MLVGCYYRCPISIEENDNKYPRFFVLAQLVEYIELSDSAKVKMHDLLGSKHYYGDLLIHQYFSAKALTRCEAMSGGLVAGSWGKGTILCRASEPYSDDQPYWYWIKLADGKHIKVCETELRIEYSQMNFSPEKQLVSYEFQHPTWFLNHLKVSKNLHLINNASYGFQVLAGCRAYLMPHQVSTIARCFETMPVRYMLADEVGLGKTIEACSILKILTSENNSLRTLIVVPSALVSQWKSELHYKYEIEASTTSLKSKVHIASMEDLNPIKKLHLFQWDLVIVDETHRLLNNASWYECVQQLSQTVPHILLLSATPIQDRNEEYRRLLALLSPEQYKDMPSERFAWMVRKQKSIQKSVNQQLNRLERYNEYSDIIVDKLKEVSETLEDKALTKLINAVDLSCNDGGLDQVKQILAYICENYRMERRVIRNRRQAICERMAKRTLCSLPYTPLSLNENYNEIGAIQNTLSYLSDNGEDDEEYIESVAIPLLSALFSSPWAFEAMLKKLKINDPILLESASTWKRQAQNEHARVNTLLDTEPDMIKGRLMTAMDYIDQEADLLSGEECKLVVFTAHNATLTEFHKLFNARYAQEGVYAVAFGAHMNRKQLDDSVYAFQNDPDCCAIICDETGGEGRNFQNATQIIHLDMPWNANALEQRIGRLDRLGRDPDMDVLSVVLHAKDSVEEQLFHIWKDGMKLFEQSLSGLEIITKELNELIVEALLDDYHTGLANAFDDILDQAEEMRESVEDEQDFDLGATLYRPLSQGIDNVLSIYSEEDNNLFAHAMMGWAGQAGLSARNHTRESMVEFRERDFSINAARQSLFIPPNWDKYRDSSIMLREGKILGSFDRKTAALREDLLFFAPGDAVYDSIITNAIGCSRGRCTAIETTDDFNYEGIIYIYNVEPVIDKLLDEGYDLQLLSQYRMYLPLKQIIIPVALNAKSREIPENTVIEKLLSLTHRDIYHLGKRSSSKQTLSRLERFMLRFPESTWESLVRNCNKISYKKAINQMLSESDLESAKQEMLRVINGYRAEALYFERDTSEVEQKRQVLTATLKALASSKPILDAVCYLRIRNNG